MIAFTLHTRDRQEADYSGYARIPVEDPAKATSSIITFPCACGTRENVIHFCGIAEHTSRGEAKDLFSINEAGNHGLNVCCGVTLMVHLGSDVLARLGFPPQRLFFAPWIQGPGGRIVRAISKEEAASIARIGGESPWPITVDQALERIDAGIPNDAPGVIQILEEGTARRLIDLGVEEYEPPPYVDPFADGEWRYGR